MPKLQSVLRLDSDVYGGRESKSYVSSHVASTVFNTTFKVTNSDTFKELLEFKPDGSLAQEKFNFLVIANDGEQTAEIQILLREFHVDGTEIAEDGDPYSGTLDFMLSGGEYITLPTSKMFLYSSDHADSDPYSAGDTSAGNNDGTSAYGVAYATTGPVFIDPPFQFIADGGTNIDGTTDVVAITADSTDYFEADLDENFMTNMQWGNDTTGMGVAKICLFGEADTAQVGTVYAVAAVGNGTSKVNTKLTITSIDGSSISNGDGTYIGAYLPVMSLDETLSAGDTTITYDKFGSAPSSDNQMFKKYDVIRIGNELMQVTGMPTSTTITVTRGVLGTTDAAHTDNDGIGFHYMSDVYEYLDGTNGDSQAATAGCAPHKGHSNIYTNASGGFYASSFFGLGRSDSFPNGLVPGSIALKFYSPAKFRLGVTNLSERTLSGLAANTEHRFKITVDGVDYNDVDFTTDATDVGLGNSLTGVGVLNKINQALIADSVPVRVKLIQGDIVFVGLNRFKGSRIAVANATSGSGTQLFGSGIFPALTALRGLIKPTLAADENTNEIMFDDGKGHLHRVNGGYGYINYETGAFVLYNCPANSHMKIACTFNSALSGSVKTDRKNFVPVIKARSTNAFRDAKIKVVAFDDIINDSNVEYLSSGIEADEQSYIQSEHPGGYDTVTPDIGGGSGV